MMAGEEMQARRFIISIIVIDVILVNVHFLVGQVFPCLLNNHHNVLLPFPLRKNVCSGYS